MWPFSHGRGDSCTSTPRGDAAVEGTSRRLLAAHIAALKHRTLASPSMSGVERRRCHHRGCPSKALDLKKRPDDSVQREGQALRNEERRRAADERRRELLEERQAKQEETTARTDKARQRRENAAEKIKLDTKERTESASKRADENLQQVKERAQKTLAKVDDVLFVNDMQQKVKTMKTELKATEAEQHQEQLQENRREEMQRAATVRQETHAAVIDRQRDLSQQRAERQQQREQQRQDNLKRLEESKRVELEQKHQKAEERERRVQQNQQEASAEAEAKSRKTEERIQQSVQLREEQREKQKQKSDKNEQKQKEAKERRDQEGTTVSKTTFAGVLPVLSPADEEIAAQRLARSVATSQRQGRAFVDTFQKECTLGAKDVNKSRLRAIFSRISPTNLTASRAALHEIAGAFLLSDVDHEYIRFSNSFEALIKVFAETRKTKDMATLKTCSDVLHRLLLDPTEGGNHIKYFVRAGHLMGLMVLFYDEVKSLRKHNQSTALTVTLSLVQICVGCIVAESQTSAKLAPLRDQMVTDLDAVGVDRFCFAVASTCVDEEDVPALQYSLLILSHQLQVSAKRKSDGPTTVAWIRGAVSSLFTLLLNLLSPKGQPIAPSDAPLSPAFTAVMFASLRVLNSIARWRLDCVQDLLRTSLGDSVSSLSAALATATTPTGGATAAAEQQDPLSSSASAFAIGGASRVELYHIALGFFTYIGIHDNLERMATDAATIAEISAQHPSASFTEAVQFGVTRCSLPRAPLPASCSSFFSTDGLPAVPVPLSLQQKGHDLERPFF